MSARHPSVQLLEQQGAIVGPSLRYQLLEGVATITLDDGKANVMSVTTLLAIRAALARAEADKAVVVIQGRPGMFSGGFDLSVFRRDRQELFSKSSSRC